MLAAASALRRPLPALAAPPARPPPACHLALPARAGHRAASARCRPRAARAALGAADRRRLRRRRLASVRRGRRPRRPISPAITACSSATPRAPTDPNVYDDAEEHARRADHRICLRRRPGADPGRDRGGTALLAQPAAAPAAEGGCRAVASAQSLDRAREGASLFGTQEGEDVMNVRALATSSARHPLTSAPAARSSNPATTTSSAMSSRCRIPRAYRVDGTQNGARRAGAQRRLACRAARRCASRCRGAARRPGDRRLGADQPRHP